MQTGDDAEIPTEMLEMAFREIDEDGSGSIDASELVDALHACGLHASKAATDTVLKEIDKNASGDVDIHEFIEFFRHIEELNRFHKRTEARKQFLTFLLNFCFLADLVACGVLLMMFIRIDDEEKEKNPDNYAIMKNVLIAAGAVLGILFIIVITVPILRLTLRGPVLTVTAQVRNTTRRRTLPPPAGVTGTGPAGGGPPSPGAAAGPRGGGWGAPAPLMNTAQPVNGAMFGSSYRGQRQISDQSAVVCVAGQ